MGCLAEMETGGGKERSEGRNFEKSDTGWAAGKEIQWGTCAWQRWRRQEGREKKWREGTLKRGVREREGLLEKRSGGVLGKDGNRRGEGNAWQKWKQEGRRECLAKMETGGEKGMLGKDGNRRGEGNAWQRWKQEGGRECLAKMETGGGKGMLGKDGNRRGEGNAWQRWKQEGGRKEWREGTVTRGIREGLLEKVSAGVGMRRLVGD